MLVQEKNELEKARSRVDRAGVRSASPTAMFEKVLRAFEIGDLSFSDLQSSLTRLLKDGAPAEELMRVLRRRESIEPLPEDARDKIIAALHEAMPDGAAQGGGADQQPRTAAEASDAMQALAAEEESDSSAMSRLIEEFAAAWDAEPRARPAPAAATPESTAQNVDYKAMRLVLGQREDDLAALQAEHTRVLSLLEARARSVAQLQEELRELSAQAEASRDALQRQRSRLHELEKALTERDARLAALRGENALLTRTLESGAAEREASAARDAREGRDAWADKVVALQRSLDERDAAFEEQKQQHAKSVAALRAQAKATETELQAAREDIEALAAELHDRDLAAAAMREQLAQREHAPSLEPALSVEPALDVEREPDLEHTLPLQPVFQSPAPRLELRRDFKIGEFASPRARSRAPKRRSNAIGWVAGICAVIGVLAIVVWVFTHRVPESAKAPVVAAAGPLPAPGTVIRDCPTCPSFTVVPAGRFKQGSVAGNASASVRPLHWVAIQRPFAISTSAVTVDQFRTFVMATGRDMRGCDIYDGHWKNQLKNSWQNPGFEQSGTHPVTCVSWNDATAYAQWLSAQTGHRYRLPSASEWEYAARGGSAAAQPWSANGSDACANANVADAKAARRFPGWVAFACNDGYVFTAPVGSFKANAFGLNDMLGNVLQWTEDCWNANYKGAPIDGSARTDGNCSERELRGGSWFTSPDYVRADYRNHFAADYRTSSAGIRLVRDITP